ncbi:MAG: hypothetical protein ACOZNI_31285 [Myxococcota bacterium]
MPATLEVAHTWDGVPCEPAARVALARDGDGLRVRVEAPRRGDPPPAAPPGPLWGLWEHEVVELFVLGPGERYAELELGPHGHYLLLALEGRRRVVGRELPLDVRWTDAGLAWIAETRLPAGVLPPEPWRLNAYAIHGVGERRRYHAWAPVPGPAPDFHRLDVFRAVAL